MPGRRFVPFEDLWSMRIDVPVSLLVRDGDLAWSCGQCPLDRNGGVLALGDPVAQSRLVCDTIAEVLRRGGLGPEAVAKLLVYLAVPDTAARDRALEVFRDRFAGGPLILPVLLPHFYYPGMRVEVDVFASAAALRHDGLRDAATGMVIELVDGGELVWATLLPGTAGADAVLDALGGLLRARGLTSDDLLSDHWFLPAGEPGPPLGDYVWAGSLANAGAAVRVAQPGWADVAVELTFARGTAGPGGVRLVSDGKVVFSERRLGEFLWLVARSIDADLDLVGQTGSVMAALAKALADHGFGFRDVVKSTTHYVGAATPEDLHRNLAVRNRFYRAPGPASTGVPVVALEDPRSLIAVDLTARLAGPGPARST